MKISLNNSKYFKKYERNSNYIHESVPVTYQTFIIDNEKYFQIDFYKKSIDIKSISPEIQSKHKLQFDKENAKMFIDILKNEFDIK